MKYLVTLFFLSAFLFSCKSDEEPLDPESIFPRIESYVGTSDFFEAWGEVVIVNNMSQVIPHNLDTTFQDTIKLIYTKLNDDINLQVLFNDTSVVRTLDSSGEYFTNGTPPGHYTVIIDFKNDNKLYFKNSYFFIGINGWSDRRSFEFEGVKL